MSRVHRLGKKDTWPHFFGPFLGYHWSLSEGGLTQSELDLR